MLIHILFLNSNQYVMIFQTIVKLFFIGIALVIFAYALYNISNNIIYNVQMKKAFKDCRTFKTNIWFGTIALIFILIMTILCIMSIIDILLQLRL